MENKIGRQNPCLRSKFQIKEINKLLASSDFKSFKIINEDLVQINR